MRTAASPSPLSPSPSPSPLPLPGVSLPPPPTAAQLKAHGEAAALSLLAPGQPKFGPWVDAGGCFRAPMELADAVVCREIGGAASSVEGLRSAAAVLRVNRCTRTSTMDLGASV